MKITARPASELDIPALLPMYRDLEAEQAALRPLWPLADGLDEPIEESLAEILADGDSVLYVGELDGVPLGFLWARIEPLLRRAGGRPLGVIRLIFTEPAARGVGIGHEMIDAALTELRARGVTLFDAVVSPGHRHAKNFFEAHGFKARSIRMHHDDTAHPPEPG